MKNDGVHVGCHCSYGVYNVFCTIVVRNSRTFESVVGQIQTVSSVSIECAMFIAVLVFDNFMIY